MSFLTLDKSIIARGLGSSFFPDHCYATYMGDGSSKVSVIDNLFFNFEGRMPLQRHYTTEFEYFNNAWYGGNESWGSFVSTAEARYEGNLCRLGPQWGNIRGLLKLESGNKVYLNDNLTDSTIGKVNTRGWTRDFSPLGAPSFAGSGYIPRAASTVAAFMTPANVGPLLYGGGVNPVIQSVFDDFNNGNVERNTFPAPMPAFTGETYPACNENGVPLKYLELYPDRTDPSAIITTGNFAGLCVAEAIGAWLVSPYYTP